VARVIMLDASVVIAFLDSDDAQHDTAQALLAREVDDEFAINLLTLAEVLVGPAREGRVQAVMDTLRDLEVAQVDFASGSSVQLAQLRADTRLRMPDCCVLLSAVAESARVASFDNRLNQAAANLGLTALGR
jgi:predicted nucleic acid-binding protein